jgi:hypothetical protein
MKEWIVGNFDFARVRDLRSHVHRHAQLARPPSGGRAVHFLQARLCGRRSGTLEPAAALVGARSSASQLISRAAAASSGLR